MTDEEMAEYEREEEEQPQEARKELHDLKDRGGRILAFLRSAIVHEIFAAETLQEIAPSSVLSVVRPRFRY